MNYDEPYRNAAEVLKPETLKLLEENLHRDTLSLVDGWAVANPERLKELEAKGELLDRAKQAQEEELQADYRARLDSKGVRPPLSSWEMAEVYGGASRTEF